MSKDLIYLIGVPGAGKTTLMSALLSPLVEGANVRRKPLLHTIYPNGLIQLGATREAFGGTDALPMNVQPIALQFLRDTDAPAIIAEGDRLANGKFFTGAALAGWSVQVLLANVPLDIAAKRRQQRGSRQKASWVAGRVTKVRRLWEEWGSGPDAALDTTRPAVDVASDLIEGNACVRRALGVEHDM